MNKRALVVFLMVLVAHTALANDGQKDLNGTWQTESPVPYIVEHTSNHPHGKPVPHESLNVLERSASMEWSLVQRSDGLISGVNRWVAYDERGKKVYEGAEALMGVYDGQRVVLMEAPDDVAGTAQIKFEAAFDGPDRIIGIGYSVGASKLLAMRYVLVRKH